MSKDQFEDFLGKKRRQSRNRGAGSSLEILHLPPEQRRIINWIRRKKKCTLAEVANYLEKEQEIVSSDLEDLIKAGFLQTNQAEGGTYYSPTSSEQNQGKVSSQFLQELT
ncbi:MAG: hypothetical protein WA896_21690, partial [Spirulinaceae cyanobacterium]